MRGVVNDRTSAAAEVLPGPARPTSYKDDLLSERKVKSGYNSVVVCVAAQRTAAGGGSWLDELRDTPDE